MVAASTAGDGRVPVHGKGATDEYAREDGGEGKHGDENYGESGCPDHDGNGEYGRVEKENGDFGKPEGERPQELQGDEELKSCVRSLVCLSDLEVDRYR